MSFPIDIVVLSNIEKNVGDHVELRVGIPYKDPWTLPFPHKQLFADRIERYDLFLYSEDDMLVTERNLRAFLEAKAALPADLIPGFLQYEEGPEGRNYPEFHGHFHWDTASPRKVGPYTLAFFSNEHSGCYVLTQAQLRLAIHSGGFLVPPHQEKYDLLCTASTDPYTQCGFEKVICISHVDDFLVHHLPNKYVGTNFGIDDNEFHRQIQALLSMAERGEKAQPLFPTETRLRGRLHSRSYYEALSPEVEGMLPPGARTVLSIGCGFGALEEQLDAKGMKVTGLALDALMPGCTAARKIEVIHGSFSSARSQLAGRTFDCLLFSNALHLIEDPVGLLSSFRDFASERGTVLVVLPNMARPVRLRTGQDSVANEPGSFATRATHLISAGTVLRWFRQAGLRVRKMRPVLTPGAQRFNRLTLGLAARRLASELVVAGEFHG